MTMRPWSVLLCGYYGMGNLGDELLARACIDRLTGLGVPREGIAMLSGDVAESERRHAVAAVDRWSPVAVWRALRCSKTLLLGGGGLFQDSSSLRSPLYYWAVVRMAQAARCRPWAFSQSIGPLRSPLSRALARDAFKICSVRAVRDRPSLEALRRMGLQVLESCDLALGCSLDAVGQSGNPCWLINLRPWDHDLEYRAAEAFEALQPPDGVLKIGVAMAPEDQGLMERLEREGKLHLQGIFRVDEKNMAQAFGVARWAFGMRLHFGVLSLISRVPCTLIPYDPKVESLAEQWGLPLWSMGIPKAAESARFEKLEEAKKDLDRLFRECLNEVMK